MGLFSKSNINNYNKINTHKYCEQISGDLEYEIAKRIRDGRLIKDIKFVNNGSTSIGFILYDYEAEEKRRQQQELEKNNSGDVWSRKLENDKK